MNAHDGALDDLEAAIGLLELPPFTVTEITEFHRSGSASRIGRSACLGSGALSATALCLRDSGGGSEVDVLSRKPPALRAPISDVQDRRQCRGERRRGSGDRGDPGGPAALVVMGRAASRLVLLGGNRLGFMTSPHGAALGRTRQFFTVNATTEHSVRAHEAGVALRRLRHPSHPNPPLVPA